MNYGIALGSNLGDRLKNIRDAVRRLVAGSVRLIAVAPVYESEPVDCPAGSQNFFNTVIEIETELAPLDLLEILRAIETELGRAAERAHHAPRSVDLDMLYAADTMLDSMELMLPHPRMTQRRFVLQPLADIRPALILPGQKMPVAELLRMLPADEPPLKLVERNWLP